MRLTLVRITLAWMLGFVASCAGHSEPPAITPDKLTGAPATALPLPIDPWAVIADGASSVLSADVVALRASAHAGFLRRWVQAAGCLESEQAALLFDKTQRALGASWPDDSAQDGAMGEALMVLKGAYTDSDAQTVLDAYAALMRQDAAPTSAQMHKRIRVLTRGDAAAARGGTSR